MQNRLATAILMAVGYSLAVREANGTWEAADTGEFLEEIKSIVDRLLAGDVIVNGEKGTYPPMQLTGSNMVQNAYSGVAADFLKSDTAAELGGYNE